MQTIISSLDPHQSRLFVPRSARRFKGRAGAHRARICRAATSASASRSISRRVVVDAERGADGTRQAQMVHQRLRAMVAGAHAHAALAQQRAGIMRMHAIQREGNDADPVPRHADGAHAGNFLPAARARIASGCGRAPRSGPSRWPSMKSMAAASPTAGPIGGVPASKRCGGSANSVCGEADGADHVAAALPGRHGRQQVRLAIEHADAIRAVELVAGEDQEVAIPVRHIDREMRRRLGARRPGRRRRPDGRARRSP